MKITALVLFILMYILIIKFQDIKEYIAFGTAILFIVLGILPVDQILDAVNLNVFMMLGGTMIIVYYFIRSKMPALIADKLLDLSPNVLWLTIFMSAFAGLISAFIDNTATVLMIAPIGIAVCKKLNKDPTAMILCLAISSNLQGAATLVGDTTSIMLGSYAKMDFNSFFFLDGKPSIFFAVELGAIASLGIMYFMFRKNKEKVSASKDVKVNDYFPTIILIALILSLIGVSFLPDTPRTVNGLLCLIFALLTLIGDQYKNKKENAMLESIKNIDFQTLSFLLNLFLVIGGISNIGLIEDFANFIGDLGGSNTFLLYTIIVWGSAVISMFIDNIPYVATMLPVIESICATTTINPYLLYFGLLSGATLGGNLTPIGASANVSAVGLLKKEGYKVSFKEFMKYGIPLTLSALLVGYLFIWFVWS
jgi:Na+/H+ antiporter NhaD/arsenite permease-like protein